MKMSKNYRRLCAVLGLSLVCGTGMVSATSGSKPVLATYRNIQITYNGVTKTVTDVNNNIVEPFAINGTTYVPLRGVSQILGVNADWIPSTNTVTLTGTVAGSTTGSSDVSAYITKINDLSAQLAAAQKELAALKASSSTSATPGTNITLDQISAAEDMLNNDYADYMSGITFDIDLKKSSSKFYVTLDYNKSSANKTFDDLSKKRIDGFLESLCQSLTEKYPDMAVDGTITYNDVEKYNFTYSKTGVYDGEAVIELDENDIEEYILEEYNSFDSSNIDSLTLKDASVKINDSKETITCEINVKRPNDDDITKWNNNNSDKLLRYDLSDLAESIQTEYNTSYSVIIYLYDSAASDCKVATWKDNDLSLYNWDK